MQERRRRRPAPRLPPFLRHESAAMVEALQTDREADARPHLAAPQPSQQPQRLTSLHPNLLPAEPPAEFETDEAGPPAARSPAELENMRKVLVVYQELKTRRNELRRLQAGHGGADGVRAKLLASIEAELKQRKPQALAVAAEVARMDDGFIRSKHQYI